MLATHPRSQPARLYFLGHLKVALTILVILHHIGQPYGPTGGFWYFEDDLSFPLLGPFFRVNASFFMGLFFLVSGYFMPGSLDRKGTGAYLKDRLVRLGIPMLTLFLTLPPALLYTHYVQIRGGSLPFWQYITQIYLGAGPRPAGLVSPSWPELQFGHLWFVEHLLVYAVCYALGRALWKGRGARPGNTIAPPGDGAVALFILALSAVTLLIRIWFPIDRWIGFLGFIQAEPAHVPQYLSFLIIGAVAYRNDWLRTFPAARGLRWLWVGLALSLVPPVVTMMKWEVPGPVDVLWECSFAVAIAIGLMTCFRERLNGASRLMEWMGANAFAAYLIHVPIVVALQYALAPAALGALVKFLIVSAIGVPLTFGLSALLRRIPAVRAIL